MSTSLTVPGQPLSGMEDGINNLFAQMYRDRQEKQVWEAQIELYIQLLADHALSCFELAETHRTRLQNMRTSG